MKLKLQQVNYKIPHLQVIPDKWKLKVHDGKAKVTKSVACHENKNNYCNNIWETKAKYISIISPVSLRRFLVALHSFSSFFALITQKQEIYTTCVCVCEKTNFRLIFIHLHKFLLAATCRMRNLLAKQRTTICRSFSFRISRFFFGIFRFANAFAPLRSMHDTG